jgi:hypothetical protein
MCIKKLVILAVLFAIVASPMTYGITRDIFGSWVASPSGCASGGGVLLHAAVFAGALYLMWKLSKKMGKEGLSPVSLSKSKKPVLRMAQSNMMPRHSMAVPPMTRMMTR